MFCMVIDVGGLGGLIAAGLLQRPRSAQSLYEDPQLTTQRSESSMLRMVGLA